MIYHRKSMRLTNYDYRNAGVYFITICTKDRNKSLGRLIQNKMELSVIGRMVYDCWYDIPNHHKNIELGEFIIMPDHIHGIIFIKSDAEICPGKSVHIQNSCNENCSGKFVRREYGKPIAGSLSVIINHFKAAVKRWCNKNGYQWFAWHKNFYERIVRNDFDLIRISEYIRKNPYK